MEMSDTLRNSLNKKFPNGIIYSTELCKAISIHHALYQEAKKADMSTSQFCVRCGFVWKDIEPVMDYPCDRIADDLDVISLVEHIYASQALLGNAILTEQQYNDLYSYAKAAFDKRFVYNTPLTLIEKKALVLEIIYALQNQSTESDDSDEAQPQMWVYLIKYFCGYTREPGSAEYQRYYQCFRKYIEEVMTSTKHLLVPAKTHDVRYQRYYDTLLIHALEPAEAVNRFLTILFDFYVNTLDCQYIPGDPAFKLLVKAIKAKWNDRFDSAVDVRSVTVSSSFKTLLELCQGYSCEFCANIIQKMDVIASSYGIGEQLDIKHFRINRLVYQWFQQRSREQRKQVRVSRNSHRNDRVAIHKSDIRASYKLINGNACIVLPKIRFEESECALIANGNRPQVIVSLDDEEIHADKCQIFGNRIYTSREYRFEIEQVQGDNLHFTVKIIIGDDGREIFNSEKKLYRNYLLLDRNSKCEIINISKNVSDAAYLYVPSASDVNFDEEFNSIREIPCGFARKFALETADLHLLTVNGEKLYADGTIKSCIRIWVSPEKDSIAAILSENGLYAVHSRIDSISIELPEGEREEQYQIQVDDKVFQLTAYFKSQTAYLALLNMAGEHKILLFNLAKGKTAFTYRYFILPKLTCAMNLPIYFDEGKTVTVQTYDQYNGNRIFTNYCEAGNDTFQIPNFIGTATLQLDLPVVHASLIRNGQPENIFVQENKDIWKGDFTPDSFLRINCPKGWSAKLFVANEELVCARLTHLYEIGNFIQAHKGQTGKKDLVLRLERTNHKPVFYNLLTIHFSPLFTNCPLIYENSALYWEIEENFIGNRNQDFHLHLYDVEAEPYSYLLYGRDEKIENNLFLPDGIYRFAVTSTESDVFHSEELELYKGQLVIGNPYDFKYRNAILKLKSASCWDWKNGVYNILALRESMTRIVNLRYIDYSDAPAKEDGKCPHYQGILQFWNTKRESWFSFCTDCAKTDYEWINPVDIWLINDRFLAMLSVTGDAVYIDSNHGSILNKSEQTLSLFEKNALQIPDKFEYEMMQNK